MLDDGTRLTGLSGNERIHAHVSALREQAVEYYRAANDLYGKMLAFGLDSEHYKREQGFGRETRRIQPKTQLVFDLLRHKGAWLKTQPLRIEARPRQPMEDLGPAELAKRLLDGVTQDPLRRYKANRSLLIDSALSASRGVMWIEWSPEAGGIYFCNSDPRLTHVAPGWVHPHDPTCPWVQREQTVDAAFLRRKKKAGWHVPSDLEPDDSPRENAAAGQDATTRNVGEDNGAVPESQVVPRYTILKTFFRDDPFDHVRPETLPLPRDEWYFLDDATGDRVPLPLDVDIFDPAAQAQFPVNMEGQPYRLVQEEPQPAYKRLCVVSYPNYKGKNGVAWKGDWFDGAVNEVKGEVPFPLFWYCSYYHPLRLVGTNDVLLNHTTQLLDNVSMRQAWEQLRQMSALLITAKGALKDSDGNDFLFTDAPVQIAYAEDVLAAAETKFVQGPGINPAIVAFRDMLERAGARVGTGDIAMPSNRSRDVAAATMQALQEMGDMPLRTHKMALDDEESVALTAVLALLRAYMTTPEMLQWTTDSGDVAMAQVRGEDLLPMNVIVGSSPEWKSLNAEDVQAVAQYAGQFAAMPNGAQAMAVFAPAAGFKPSDVQRIQQWAAQMAATQQAVPSDGGGGEGGGPPPPTQ